MAEHASGMQKRITYNRCLYVRDRNLAPVFAPYFVGEAVHILGSWRVLDQVARLEAFDARSRGMTLTAIFGHEKQLSSFLRGSCSGLRRYPQFFEKALKLGGKASLILVAKSTN